MLKLIYSPTVMRSDTTPADTRVEKRVQLVIGIVRRESEVLLVKEELGSHGEVLWSLPGGGVKSGELFQEALRREIAEETGISIEDPSSSAFFVHIDSARYPSALAVAFEVPSWHGSLAPADADIEDAAFFTLDDAIEQIQRIDSIVQKEPIVAYLSGAVPPGTMWTYRVFDDGREVSMGRW